MTVLGGLGTRRYEHILFFDDSVQIQKVRMISGPSGSSSTVDGLYLPDDSDDPLTSTLGSSGSLVTGKISEGAVFNGTTNWSIGIDQGTAYNVHMISLFDTGTNGWGITFSGSNDSLTLYQSEDNSTWTLLKTYQPLIREFASGSAMTINILCDATQRYLKLYANSGPLKTSLGHTPWFSGIRTYQESPITSSSGSYNNEIRATIQEGEVKGKVDVLTSTTSNNEKETIRVI